MVVGRVWDRLREVGRLRFTSRSNRPTSTGWVGRGTGTVNGELVDGPAIISRVEGEWTPEGGRPLRFRNCYRWTTDPAGTRIHLEQLRSGTTSPVDRLDLEPAGDEFWQSAEPHACRLDAYSARPRCAEGRIRVDWSVLGPGKDESIHYEYR